MDWGGALHVAGTTLVPAGGRIDGQAAARNAGGVHLGYVRAGRGQWPHEQAAL